MTERLKAHSKTLRSLFLLGIPLAFLLSGPPRVFSSEPVSGILKGKTDQGYSFMSGGVGMEERDRMKKQANQYDLQLSFAARSGDYVSDVRVVIDDEHGNQIVNKTTAGPWFYVELPTGKYDVKATLNHRTEEINNLEISKDQRTVRLLHWDVPDSRIAGL